jgi:hypothetical protein
VQEQTATLEKFSSDTSIFWADDHHCSAIVLLQDRSQHVGEAVDSCRRALMTMFSVMLPRNPFPESFGQLLKNFKTSRRIHRLKELNLIAGANLL